MSANRERLVYEIYARKIGLPGDDFDKLDNGRKRKGMHRLSDLADELQITQSELCLELVHLMIGNRYHHHESLTEDQLIEREILDIEALDRFEDAAERSAQDWLSWAACNRIVRRARLRREIVPKTLENWNHPQPKKPSATANELLRELVTACIRVGAESGLNVYRNEATQKDSVLDIVAQCLNDRGISTANGKPFDYENVRMIMLRRWNK